MLALRDLRAPSSCDAPYCGRLEMISGDEQRIADALARIGGQRIGPEPVLVERLSGGEPTGGVEIEEAAHEVFEVAIDAAMVNWIQR